MILAGFRKFQELRTALTPHELLKPNTKKPWLHGQGFC
jgi:hypothetical protein